MPHPESEHGLRVQLATALRALEEEKALAMRVGERAWAAEAERDSLRTEMKRLRDALEEIQGGHALAGDDPFNTQLCWRCSEEWPCATARTIDAALAAGGEDA